jgi:hypothetical protein
VASILSDAIGDRYRVRLMGALTWRDLSRLEAACSRALEYAVLPLELDVAELSSMDGAALAYVERLLARGAHIVGLDDVRSRD